MSRQSLPYELGAVARAAGMKAAANPYLWGTYPQTAWANGWHDEDKRLAAEAGPADDMARADGLGA